MLMTACAARAFFSNLFHYKQLHHQTRAVFYQVFSIFSGSGAEFFVGKGLWANFPQTINFLERSNQVPPFYAAVRAKSTSAHGSSVADLPSCV